MATPRKCRDCPSSALPSRSRCARCLFKRAEGQRKEYQLRLASGQCVHCKKRATAGGFCLQHWFRNIGLAHKLGNNKGAAFLEQIWREQHGECALTGEVLLPGVNASLDHIVPTSKGGTNDRKNLRWVLISVNRAKSDMNDIQFEEMCLAVVKHSRRLFQGEDQKRSN